MDIQPFTEGIEGCFSHTAAGLYRNDPEYWKFWAGPRFQEIDTEWINSRTFSRESREILHAELLRQYTGSGIQFSADDTVFRNIESLKNSNTFTLTTGQQIHIFLGPAYVLYKISSLLRRTAELQAKFPEYRFVPVFWMASEDHDLEEVQHFSPGGSAFSWDAAPGGPVGRKDTAGIAELLTKINEDATLNPSVKALLNEWGAQYGSGISLADATRKILHSVFAEFGLVVLNPDAASLKASFTEPIRKEMEQQSVFRSVTAQSAAMKQAGLESQAGPRPVNLFYMTDMIRERLIPADSGFAVNNSDIRFTPESIESELSEHPERFSPNVLFRPVYQEFILPNLGYVAGPGEAVYWLQDSQVFQEFGLRPPALILRDSYIHINAKSYAQLKESGLEPALLFSDEAVISGHILDQLSGKSTLPVLMADFNRMKDLWLAELYQYQHPSLKSEKQAWEDFAKRMRLNQAELLSFLASSPKVKPQIDRMLKFKSRFFNPSRLTERTDTVAQVSVYGGNVHELVKNLLSATESPLSLLIY